MTESEMTLSYLDTQALETSNAGNSRTQGDRGEGLEPRQGTYHAVESKIETEENLHRDACQSQAIFGAATAW